MFSGVLLFSLLSGIYFGGDPYYEMNASNLNTMNSYILPSKATINPINYPELMYQDGFFGITDLHLMSSYVGVVFELIFIVLLIRIYRYKRNTNFMILFESLYESIFQFFENILGKHQHGRVKNYVVSLFFIILIANLFGIINDIIRFIFPWRLRNVTSVTAEMEFNIALAFVGVVITLYVQRKRLGRKLFLHEYFPIFGKGLIEGKGILNKIGDIAISLFISFLDIIGILAKVVSLSMRLFGNMSSGGILLNVAFLGIGGLTVSLIGFNLPLFLPIIVYIQGIMVAVVQAFVFALLMAIFIKIASE